MAIEKEIQIQGAPCNYWKILAVYPNTLYNSTTVKVAIYKDKEARDTDGSSYSKVMRLSISKNNLTLQEAYDYLKNISLLDGYKDA